MNAEQIIKKMRAQRERRVDVGGGRSVTLLLPTELQVQRDMLKLLPPGPGGEPGARLELAADQLHHHIIDWHAFTTADLLGPSGSDDPAPFAPALVQEWLAEHTEAVATITKALLQAINDRFTQKAEAEKNS